MILFVVLKVIKCKLAVERKGNVVATGTLIEEKGSNRLVVINIAHKLDARLHFQIHMRLSMFGMLLALSLTGLTNLVILKIEHP